MAHFTRCAKRDGMQAVQVEAEAFVQAARTEDDQDEG
jgi:hypothetical protein